MTFSALGISERCPCGAKVAIEQQPYRGAIYHGPSLLFYVDHANPAAPWPNVTREYEAAAKHIHPQ